MFLGCIRRFQLRARLGRPWLIGDLPPVQETYLLPLLRARITNGRQKELFNHHLILERENRDITGGRKQGSNG